MRQLRLCESGYQERTFAGESAWETERSEAKEV